MNLPPLLAQVRSDELRTALGLIDRGGPYTAERISLIRNLHVYRYADVQVHERRRESGAVVTDIVAARLTDRGRALLEELAS